MDNKPPLILIVDDNPQNCQFLGNLLAENGYELGVARDGLKALEFVRNDVPDLILLDIMMPGMDGYEVCAKLKAGLGTMHIPVIFLTAKTGTEAIVKGFRVGGADYVTKPFNSDELLARVNTHVEMKILRAIMPICSSCRCIRDDNGYWNTVEKYMGTHLGTLFTHGLCPKCADKLYGDEKWYSKEQGEG